MRDMLADWALRRARAAVDTANTATRSRRGRHDLGCSAFWHACVLWLDGLAPFPAEAGGCAIPAGQVKTWLLVWGAVAAIACLVLVGGAT